VSIPRDPGGAPSPLDICFCGYREARHPTLDGCSEFQSLRHITNVIANTISEVVETLLLAKVAQVVADLEEEKP
jgi:hypothetical protein